METPSNWSSFQGVVPLLALPASVVMPYAVQPMQLQGPTAHALMQHFQQGHRLIGLTILKTGWEALTDPSAAPVHAHGCLTEVTAQHSTPGERTVMMVRGLCRIRIEVVQPTQQNGLLRTAEVVAVADRYPSPPAIDRTHRRDELLEAFQDAHFLESLELFDSLLRHELSLGCLTDMLAQSLTLSPAMSAELLRISNVDERSDLLLDSLRSIIRSRSAIPAVTFSCN